MLFDFGFNLNPSVDDIKNNSLNKRLINCEARLRKISTSKIFTRNILILIREELELRDSLKRRIDEYKQLQTNS